MILRIDGPLECERSTKWTTQRNTLDFQKIVRTNDGGAVK
jgi:hypothetical protein